MCTYKSINEKIEFNHNVMIDSLAKMTFCINGYAQTNKQIMYKLFDNYLDNYYISLQNLRIHKQIFMIYKNLCKKFTNKRYKK